VGCGIQALAFILTGNVLAPILAHIVLHLQLTLRGTEMPPVSEAPLEFPAAGRSGLSKDPAPEKELVA
jgi:hypothetical protein